MAQDTFYQLDGQIFVWNTKKARRNLAKHGVSFKEAAEAFGDTLAVVKPDPDHSGQEERKILVGNSARGLLVVVAYTDRKALVRLISARRATRRERKTYEEETA